MREVLCGISRPYSRWKAAALPPGLGIEMPKDFDQRRHQPGPSGLMAGADACAVVAMEIFIEQQAVAPVGVALELLGSAEHRPPAGFIVQEDPSQSVGDFARDLEQVHRVARAGGALDFEVVAIIQVILQQGADQQHVDRHPDRPAPVRIAAKHAGVRLRREVVHPIFLALRPEGIGLIGVITRQSADPVGAEELVLIEHSGKDPAQPALVHQSQNAAFGDAKLPRPGGMDRRAEFRHAPHELQRSRD
jgi:hypothetical protein